MAEAHFEKKIKPYEVTVDILKELEEYILKELPSKLELDPDKVQRDYNLRLSYGRSETIKLDSIEEFRGETFKDDLEQVYFSLGVYTFLLKFSTKKMFSKIELYTPGDSRSEAEERGNSIIGDIEDTLRGNEKRSMAVLYHPWFSTYLFIGLGLGLLFNAVLFSVFNQLLEKQEILSIWYLGSGFLFFLLGGLVSLLKRYHPYTWFESNKIDRLQTIDGILFKWIPISLVGGLIVTAIVRLFQIMV